MVAEQVAVGAMGQRLLDIGVRLLDRSGVRGVDRSGRLVGVGRAVIVGAGRSGARGNEKGGGGKSDLGHSGYSRFEVGVSVLVREDRLIGPRCAGRSRAGLVRAST